MARPSHPVTLILCLIEGLLSRYLIDVVNTYKQVTLNKGDYHEQCGWSSSNQLKVKRAKTDFPKEEKFCLKTATSAPA